MTLFATDLFQGPLPFTSVDWINKSLHVFKHSILYMYTNNIKLQSYNAWIPFETREKTRDDSLLLMTKTTIVILGKLVSQE